MARKKKAEEHENLERWLVSYADFMTLLFATFVVLYGLAQTNENILARYIAALKDAFEFKIPGKESLIDGNDSLLEGYNNNKTSLIMLEYISLKYEQTSFEEIKEDVEKLKQDGVSAEIDERGLVIRFSDKAVKFRPGSAEIEEESKKTINDVGKIIKSKFSIHYLQIEGHTDSDALFNSIYPSNWELSSARASSVIRFLIKNNNFNPKLFSAVGLADTVPIVENNSPSNKAKNRRVEIIVLKNKLKDLNKKDLHKIMKEVEVQQKAIFGKSLKYDSEGYIRSDKDMFKDIIDMSEQYSNETERLDMLEKEDYIFDGEKPDFMETKDERK